MSAEGSVLYAGPTAARGRRDSVVFLDITMKTFIQRLFPSLAKAAKKPDPMLRLYLAHLNGPPRVMPMHSKGI